MHGESDSTTGLTCAPPEGGGESGEQPDRRPNRSATRSGPERPGRRREREGRGARKERQQQQQRVTIEIVFQPEQVRLNLYQ